MPLKTLWEFVSPIVAATVGLILVDLFRGPKDPPESKHDVGSPPDLKRERSRDLHRGSAQDSALQASIAVVRPTAANRKSACKPNQSYKEVKPPPTLDGMRVLEWAWSDEPFGLMGVWSGRADDAEGESIAIHGFAICLFEHVPKYEWIAKRRDTYYFFSCNASWEVENDSECGSVEDGKARLPGNYAKAKPNWHRWEA
jgi:hypothetical protein